MLSKSWCKAVQEVGFFKSNLQALGVHIIKVLYWMRDPPWSLTMVMASSSDKEDNASTFLPLLPLSLKHLAADCSVVLTEKPW
jgi:hypothetical protein